MPNDTMNFGVDLLPITTETYNLGSSDKKWNIYGSLTGNASTATTATNLDAAPTLVQAGTSTIDLSPNTTYTLTVGGKSVIFKTPNDTKVTQSNKVYSSYTYWRPLVIGARNASTASGLSNTATDTTDLVYTFSNIVAQPSTGTIKASVFDGNATSATTATTWQTARAITIGDTSHDVDGSAAVTWTKDEILGTSTAAYFLRGDKNFSNVLTYSHGKAISALTATASDTNAWNKEVNCNLKLTASNNTLIFTVGGTGNERTALIQAGHATDDYAQYPGTLYINKFGNNVYLAGTTIYADTSGGMHATTFNGNLSGNATTATALTSNAGGGEQPIYFSNGKPTATTYYLKANITNGTNYYQVEYSNNGRTLGNSGILRIPMISYTTVTPDYTSGGEQYYKAAIKYIAANYGDADFLLGRFNPNSQGPFIGHIYDVNDKDSTTGLPRYSTFIFHNLGGGLESFGTINYNYYYRQYVYNSGTWGISITGNAASATKVAAKLAATTKTYLLGTSTAITTTAANVDIIGDTGIYATTTSGELSAVRHSWNISGTEKVYSTWNTADSSLDFIFV